MSEADRHNAGKPRLSFNALGREVQNGEAAVWEAGAEEYAPGNWLKGCSWVEATDSMYRHLNAFLAGEDLDPKSGLPHVDHLVCSAKILSNTFHVRKDLDDRVRTVGVDEADGSDRTVGMEVISVDEYDPQKRWRSRVYAGDPSNPRSFITYYNEEGEFHYRRFGDKTISLDPNSMCGSTAAKASDVSPA